jgi:hypothetical protein
MFTLPWRLNLRIHRLDHTEDGHYDIYSAVPLIPQIPQTVQRVIYLLRLALLHHLLDHNGMGLIANFEDVVWRDKVEPRICRLQIIDGLSHVTFRCEDQGGDTLVRIWDLFVVVSKISKLLEVHRSPKD